MQHKNHYMPKRTEVKLFAEFHMKFHFPCLEIQHSLCPWTFMQTSFCFFMKKTNYLANLKFF